MTASKLNDESLTGLIHDAMKLADAPARAIEQALALWESRPDPTGSLVQRVLAVLRFDSLDMPSLALSTRTQASSVRHMVFTAEGRDFDLRIVSVPGGGQALWEVAGQVLGPDRAGAVVLEGEGGAGHWRTELSALCEFRFAPVPEGRYTMIFELQGTAIVLPELAIQRAAMP